MLKKGQVKTAYATFNTYSLPANITSKHIYAYIYIHILYASSLSIHRTKN